MKIKKYQSGSTILPASQITEELDPKWEIKKYKKIYRQGKKDYKKYKRLLKDLSDIDEDTYSDLLFGISSLPNLDLVKIRLERAKREYRSKNFLGIGDGTGSAFPSQVYRWTLRHIFPSVDPTGRDYPRGTDIITLDNNVIRLTPESSQQTALFNEYVEQHTPSIYPASEYQSGAVKVVSDNKYPASNFNIWTGIEDGHFKLDSVQNFNPQTLIFPARNIKRGIPQVHGIHIENIVKPVYNPKKHELLTQLAEVTENNVDKTALNQYLSTFTSSNPTYTFRKKYFFVDQNGTLHHIGKYDAKVLDNKLILGNPNGGMFVGRIQDVTPTQLDIINNYLRNNPSWIYCSDLGSFDQYRLDAPSLEEYLQQYYEHPDPNDPNVYTVGTTEHNKLTK